MEMAKKFNISKKISLLGDNGASGGGLFDGLNGIENMEGG